MENNKINPTVNKPLNRPMQIMKCIGIIAVVFGHADLGGSNIPTLIKIGFPYYSWHMAFFIFISGYLFNRKATIRQYLSKKIKKMLVPALFANFICAIICMLISHYEVIAIFKSSITFKSLFVAPFTFGGFFINTAVWFVFALFLIEIVSCLLDRMTKGKLDVYFLFISLFISLFCCFIAFYHFEETRGEYIYAILRFGYLLFFFWLGICYRRYWEEKIMKFINAKTAAIIFLLQALVIGLFGYTITYNTRDMRLTSISVPNGFFVPILVPILAIIFFLGISYTVDLYLKKMPPLLDLLANNTIYVVYFHQICFILCSMILGTLIRLNLIPCTPNFSFERLSESRYYIGGNAGIAFVICFLSIFIPIGICTHIKKLPKIKACLVSTGILLLIAIFLYSIKDILYP